MDGWMDDDEWMNGFLTMVPTSVVVGCVLACWSSTEVANFGPDLHKVEC
jgi:hypothetical protein